MTFQTAQDADVMPAQKLALKPPSAIGPAERTREETLRALLQTAADARVGLVAAQAEGDIERMLGQCWPFPSPFRVIVRAIPALEGVDRVEARARRSLERMGLPRGEALLAASADDLAGAEGRALWDRMQALKARGLFRRIGVRARVEDGVELLARRLQPDIVELPCSLLDQRAVQTGLIADLAGQGVAVHLHSVFAGGVLFAARADLPAALTQSGSGVSRARRRLAEARVDPMQAALAFVLNLPGVEAVSASAASPAELRAILAAANAPIPNLDWSMLALDDPAALHAGSSDAVSSAA